MQLSQHKARAAVVACSDVRFHSQLPDALLKVFKTRDNEFVDIKLEGGAGNLASIGDKQDERFRSISDDIALAIRAHGIETLILLNHEQCRLYAKLGNPFEHRNEEREFHRAELLKATQNARTLFRDVEVCAGFMHITDTDDVWIERVE